ncbi:hypothetical protein ACLOAV_009988 [Pseudogymnoascus australis]
MSYSRTVRENLKGESLSFTDIAKLAGKKWQNLTTIEKASYEQQAFDTKEKYTIELAKYKMTTSYDAYSEYLLKFKAKQLQIQKEPPNKSSKVSKLQNIPSATSTSTAKFSATSNLSLEASSDVWIRGPSLGSIPRPGFSTERVIQRVAPSTQTQADRPSITQTAYWDTVIGANPLMLVWRDHARPMDIPECSWQDERNSSQPRMLYGPDMSHSFGQTIYKQPRNLGGVSSPSLQPTLSTGGIDYQDDELTSLDPISALLKADDIFSSQRRLARLQHRDE